MSSYPASIPRCQHLKINGTQCGSPALRRNQFCYFHKKWHDNRVVLNGTRARSARVALDLPVLEDANSIQVALMQVMRLLLTNQIDHKTAALLFYALQTASSNLRATSFEPLPQQVVIDPRGVSDTNLGDDAWYKEEFEDDEEVSEERDSGEEDSDEGEDSADSEETVDIEASAAPLRSRVAPALQKTILARRVPVQKLGTRPALTAGSVTDLPLT
jgi:hypothetical protein